MKKIYTLGVILSLISSCGTRTSDEKAQDSGLTAWQRDSIMCAEIEASDHSCTDSLLTALLGEPTKCISFLRDYYRVGEDCWYVNSYFGMALQLPCGFLPDDYFSPDFVSHGSMISNPDSPIVIYVSAWYNVLTEDEREDALKSMRKDNPDAYIRQIVAQGIEYTLSVENWKNSRKEFNAMLPYLEHFPEGPHGLIPAE